MMFTCTTGKWQALCHGHRYDVLREGDRVNVVATDVVLRSPSPE